MPYARAIGAVILSFIMVSLTGCFSSNPKDIEAFVKPHEVAVTAENYVLQPPDEVEIHCSQVPGVDLQRQRIRPDGKISFEGLGEIEAAGKTIEQVTESLQAKVSELYKLAGDYPLDVRVVAYRSKSFYVLGEVYLPGPKDYTGRDTVLYALAEAKLNPMAWKQRIQVIRPSRDKNIKPKIFEVNYSRMVVHGDASKDVLLQEGDIIYVPPTVLAAFAMKIEEFIRPLARAFAGVYIMEGAGAGGRYTGGEYYR